jgi:hypothetical protein
MLNPHPEERPVGRVSKDEVTARASWFETPRLRPLGYSGLLTMRVD